MLYTLTELADLKSASTSSGHTELIKKANNILNTSPLSNFSNGIYTTETTNYQNNLGDDCQNVLLLGIAYQISNDSVQKPKYAQKAHSIITNLQEKMTSVASGSKTNISFYIPTLIFGTDLVRGYTGAPLSGSTAFNTATFKTWLTDVISPCSSKVNDTYIPNDNNVNTLWNMLDLAIGIYKADSNTQNVIDACAAYWKVLVDRQIFPTNIPPLKSNDADKPANKSLMTILPQEIDRCEKYKLGDDDQFHSGSTQGLYGIHYSNVALMAFIITVRLLKNKNEDVLVAGMTTDTPPKPILTTHGQKLRDAVETIAGFVLDPTTSPYYRFLSTSAPASFYSPNETTYMRLAAKFFIIPNISTVFLSDNQKYDRYLFLPVLQKKWITSGNYLASWQ